MELGPPRLSNAELVGWLLNRLNSVRAERLKQALSPLGLSARAMGVLTAADELSEPISQQDIASALVLDAPSVAVVAEDLERRSLIRRKRDQANRRRYIVELTQLGHETLANARELARPVEEAMTMGLGEDDAAVLHSLLSRVAAEHGIV